MRDFNLKLLQNIIIELLKGVIVLFWLSLYVSKPSLICKKRYLYYFCKTIASTFYAQIRIISLLHNSFGIKFVISSEQFKKWINKDFHIDKLINNEKLVLNVLYEMLYCEILSK